MALPALRRMYLESLLDCAATVAQPDAPGSAVSWLEAELLRERAQILAAAQVDGNKPYSNDQVDEAHQALLRFVRNRSAYVTDLARRELEGLAPGIR
jgi:DNA-binding FrmR family transcriptional regulator